MPNHVANKITVIGSDANVKRFFEFAKSEESKFDFNKFIPMSPLLNIDSNSDGERGVQYLEGDKTVFDGWSERRKAEAIDLGRKYIANKKLFGAKDWYDWCKRHWGTKWNAYEIYVEGDVITFETAWNAPEPIYEKMAELFPELEFDIVYADEDWGCNVGRLHIDKGEIDYEDISWYSDAAMECYFETHPGEADEFYKGEDGEWMRVEEDYPL